MIEQWRLDEIRRAVEPRGHIDGTMSCDEALEMIAELESHRAKDVLNADVLATMRRCEYLVDRGASISSEGEVPADVQAFRDALAGTE